MVSQKASISVLKVLNVLSYIVCIASGVIAGILPGIGVNSAGLVLFGLIIGLGLGVLAGFIFDVIVFTPLIRINEISLLVNADLPYLFQTVSKLEDTLEKNNLSTHSIQNTIELEGQERESEAKNIPVSDA